MADQGEDTGSHKHVFSLSLFPSHSYPNATPKEKAQGKEEGEGEMYENLSCTLQIPSH